MIEAPPVRTADLEPPEHDRTTTLAAILATSETGARRPGTGRLFIESTLFTGVGLIVSRSLGLEPSGVFALFLAAGALGSRAKEILRASERDGGSRASTHLLTLFAGISLAYAAATAVRPPEDVVHAFAFALEAADVGSESLLGRPFPGVFPLLGHNLVVLATIMVLSFVYRSFGALVAVAWNAAVWGVVLTSLVRRAVDGGDGAPALILSLAILPHLALEAYAYVVGALAGARLGLQLTRRARLELPLRSATTAVVALLLAAVLESTVPSALQGWFEDSTSASVVRCTEGERWNS